MPFEVTIFINRFIGFGYGQDSLILLTVSSDCDSNRLGTPRYLTTSVPLCANKRKNDGRGFKPVDSASE